MPHILGRTSQGSRSPRSGAYIRYRHISEIGEQSRTIPMAHVHGRKPKNSGDIYNVRTGGGVGKGIPVGPFPLVQSRNGCPFCVRFFGSTGILCVRMDTNGESTEKHNTPCFIGVLCIWGGGFIGRGDWIRTSDLLNPIQTLYQAEPRPEPRLPTYQSPRKFATPTDSRCAATESRRVKSFDRKTPRVGFLPGYRGMSDCRFVRGSTPGLPAHSNSKPGVFEKRNPSPGKTGKPNRKLGGQE